MRLAGTRLRSRSVAFVVAVLAIAAVASIDGWYHAQQSLQQAGVRVVAGVRDGVAKHADMKQRLEQLAENNTA